MKHSLFLVTILALVLICTACPVQAFTAKTLDIAVQENGDGVITFNYDLSWFENVAVLARMADPGTELRNALTSQFNKPVEVTAITGNQVQLLVKGFASRQERNGTVTITTPALSFREAQKMLDRYWFARFINPDFSPEVTRVRFADGFVEEFSDQDQIPQVSHILNAPAA